MKTRDNQNAEQIKPDFQPFVILRLDWSPCFQSLRTRFEFDSEEPINRHTNWEPSKLEGWFKHSLLIRAYQIPR